MFSRIMAAGFFAAFSILSTAQASTVQFTEIASSTDNANLRSGSISEVPLPGALGLFVVGLISLGMRKRAKIH